jgi:hypothetical protein
MDRKEELKEELKALNSVERCLVKVTDVGAQMRILEYHLNRVRGEAAEMAAAESDLGAAS